MIQCIEDTAIPVCIVGLLYALPGTQLERRLLREGRMFPAATSHVRRIWASNVPPALIS